MRTLLTKQQQQDWLAANQENRTLSHVWSSRGYGNSKILNRNGEQLSKATGCGYDRFGTALGVAIMELFPAEIYKLAKRTCKGKRRDYKTSESFYGLFFNSKKDKAWLDGGCGEGCMRDILNAVGFDLTHVGETNTSKASGTVFYSLEPVCKLNREFIARKGVKS